jgi:hypothetical protein
MCCLLVSTQRSAVYVATFIYFFPHFPCPALHPRLSKVQFIALPHLLLLRHLLHRNPTCRIFPITPLRQAHTHSKYPWPHSCEFLALTGRFSYVHCPQNSQTKKQSLFRCSEHSAQLFCSDNM